MTCCNVWCTTRFNFATNCIQHFFSRFVFIHSDIDITNFADDYMSYFSVQNVEHVRVLQANFNTSVQLV